jgi:type IV secretion system protein VirB10
MDIKSWFPSKPKVEDKAAPVPGLGNKSSQVKWVLGLVGVLIAGMLLSSGKKSDTPLTKPEGTTGFTPQPAKLTGPDQIKAAQQQADFQMAQINSQRAQQVQAQQLQTSMVAPPGAYPAPATIAGTPMSPQLETPATDPLAMRDYLSPISNEALPLVAKADPPADPPAMPDPKPKAPDPAPIRPKEPGPDLIEASSDPNAPFFVLPEGTTIPCTLMVRITGEFPGPADCEVSEEVWSHDHEHVIVPAGTKVLGTAAAVSGYNQKRLAVAYHRMLMPDLYPVSLDKFTGLNADGSSALAGKVNNHYLSTFGVAAIVGLIGGLTQANSGDIYASGTARLQSGIGSQMGMTSEQIMSRFLNRMPDITIPEGSRIKLYVTNDISLPDYTTHTMSPHL